MQQHYINVTKKHKLTEDEFYEKDSLQTVTVAQHNYKLKTITHLHVVQSYGKFASYDCGNKLRTGSDCKQLLLYVLANTHADIVSLYYGNFETNILAYAQ